MVKATIAAFMSICFMGSILMIPIWFCWNQTMPQLFNLPNINVWQAFILFCFCNVFIYFPIKESHIIETIINKEEDEEKED